MFTRCRGLAVVLGATVVLTGLLCGALVEQATHQDCTIFTAAQGDTVLFGNNEDTHFRDLRIGFYPASRGEFGSVHFGYVMPDGQTSFQGAVNDQGLAWDLNSTPRFVLNPHPEKPYSHSTDNYLTTITRYAATVTDAIRIAQDFDFGDELAGQFHIADATGDAVVISAGPDGEIAFTRKAPGDGYLVSTNFALAVPERGPVDWRYGTASSMLDALSGAQELTPGYGVDILNAVHLRTLTSFTLYSSVVDLRARKVYLVYMSQYGEVIELDIAKELAKGQRVMEMRSLFSAATAKAGDADYRRFESRFTAAKMAVISLPLGLAVGGIVWVVRKRSRHE